MKLILVIITVLIMVVPSYADEKDRLSGEISALTQQVQEAEAHIQGVLAGVRLMIEKMQREIAVKQQRLQQIIKSEEAKKKAEKEKPIEDVIK